MTKPYALINKKNGKTTKMFSTREAARTFKRDKGFKHVIKNMLTGEVIR